MNFPAARWSACQTGWRPGLRRAYVTQWRIGAGRPDGFDRHFAGPFCIGPDAAAVAVWASHTPFDQSPALTRHLAAAASPLKHGVSGPMPTRQAVPAPNAADYAALHAEPATPVAPQKPPLPR